MCDIAQKKETRLKAVCNIFIFLSFMGILWLAVAKSNRDIVCGYVLAETGAFGGILFGEALERLQKPYKIKPDRQAPEVIRDFAIPEYTFAQYLLDNDTTAEEAACILERKENTWQEMHRLYEHYCSCAGGERVQPEEEVTDIIMQNRRHT